MPKKPKRRPGDLLLDRYFKDADEQTREAARDAFREFAGVMERLAEAIQREREKADIEKAGDNQQIGST